MTTGEHLPPESANEEPGPPQFPIVVVTILALNVLVFVLQTLTGGSTNTLNLIRLGAQHGPSIEEGEYWRLVTAAFLHIGFLHLLFNSLCLWQLGRLLEHLFGATHFAFLYLVSGVAGTLSSFFVNEFVSPRALSAGASGAIFGVAGAMVVAGLRYSDQIPESLQKAFGTGALPFVAFNLYYGFTTPHVDNVAHLGGALAGALCGWILHPHAERPRDSRLAAAGFAVLVLLCFGLQYRAVRRYEGRLVAAQAFVNRGDIAAADRELALIAGKGAQDPRVLTLSGAVKVRQGKTLEGVNALRRATQLAPGYAAPRLVLGGVFLANRSYKAAAAEYQSAIRLEPGNTLGHVGLGEALRALNRSEEAGTACREAIRLNPRFPAGHLGLAMVLSQQERLDEAIAEFRTAVELDPSQTSPHRGLARILHSQNKNDEALKEVREILRLDPNDEWAKKVLAEMEARGGRP